MRKKLKREKGTTKGLQDGSLSQTILISIGKLFLESGKRLGAAFLPIITLDFETMLKNSGMRLIYFNPYDIGKRINDLGRRNYIEIKKTQKGPKVRLITKGIIEMDKYKIKSKIKKQKWDGRWRAVCWDVPEISRKDRDYLRRRLKWLGLKEMQKSLWIFPFDIKEEFIQLIMLYKKEFAGDIRFLTIEKIEDDKDLRRYFNL